MKPTYDELVEALKITHNAYVEAVKDYDDFEKDGEEVLKSYVEFSFDHDSFITGYKSGRADRLNES